MYFAWNVNFGIDFINVITLWGASSFSLFFSAGVTSNDSNTRFDSQIKLTFLFFFSHCPSTCLSYQVIIAIAVLSLQIPSFSLFSSYFNDIYFYQGNEFANFSKQVQPT